MVRNNTKVFPARLIGNKEKTGAKIEVFLLRELNQSQRLWDVLVDPARKIRIGNKLYFGGGEDLVAEVIDNTTSRGRTLRFLYDGPYEAFREKLHEMGQTPLPKYIKRDEEEFDRERYQTIYAKHEGAVAAPTAGLHFSKHVLKRLEIKGVCMADITLHVGLGTFNPVEVEDLSKHKMDSEELHIDQLAADMVNNAKSNKSIYTHSWRQTYWPSFSVKSHYETSYGSCNNGCSENCSKIKKTFFSSSKFTRENKGI